MTALTERFARAVDYARTAHAGQTRKGTAIPYITHLLGVAALVLEFGGDEDQAIAGLLHDTLEDCGAHHEPIIRQQFGARVADIVLACTDGTAEAKGSHTDPEAKRREWLARKQAYLAHLAEASDDVLLVSACDKLHNARAIVQDIEDPSVGLAVFERFKAGQEGTLAYYESLARQFVESCVAPAPAIDSCVSAMHALSGSRSRVPLIALSNNDRH